MLQIVQTALELGFQYALVAMALFLSYRILDIADLTTDGSFVLGAAVSVTLTAAGHPILAIPAAMAAGACAGFVTAFLQTRLGVPSILAGIITNTGLYTVNLMAMGWKSNASLLRADTVFTLLRAAGVGGEWYELLLSAGITAAAGALLWLFLGTRLGLSIRATGDNRDMVRSSSVNPAFTVTVGLCLANALTGLSGAVVGQYQKTVDTNMGAGIVVIGLACLIIGETVVGRGGDRQGHPGRHGGVRGLPLHLRRSAQHQDRAHRVPEAGHRPGGGAGHCRPSHQERRYVSKAPPGGGTKGGVLTCCASSTSLKPSIRVRSMKRRRCRICPST